MTSQESSNKKHFIAPIIALFVIAVVAWYLWPRSVLEPTTPSAAVVQPAAIEPEPQTVVEPDDVLTKGIDVPDPISEQAADAGMDPTLLGQEEKVAEKPAMPSLDDSDSFVQTAMAGLNWQKNLQSLFVNEEMVRRFVVQVDNIAQGNIVPEQAFFTGLTQDFQASRQGKQYQLAAVNYARYQPYLALLESVPPQQVVNVFNALYPLLQAAYEELGYPNQQFRARVQQAITVLIAAPEVADQPLLLLDSVQYTFADPELEQLPLAHKQMVRLGKENQQRLKLLLSTYQPLLAKP